MYLLSSSLIAASLFFCCCYISLMMLPLFRCLSMQHLPRNHFYFLKLLLMSMCSCRYCVCVSVFHRCLFFFENLGLNVKSFEVS